MKKTLQFPKPLKATALVLVLAMLAISGTAPAQQRGTPPQRQQQPARPTPKPATPEKSSTKAAEKKTTTESRKSPAEQRKSARETRQNAAAAAKGAPKAAASAPKAAASVPVASAPPIPFLGDFKLAAPTETRMLRIHPAGLPDRQQVPVIVGGEFETEVTLGNSDLKSFNEIRIILSYEPDYLEPISLNDKALASSISGSPTAEVDTKTGMLLYEARFQTPVAINNTPILTIRWKATRVTSSSLIEFGSRGGFETLVAGDGVDLLGNPKVAGDGMLSMTVSVLPEDPREAEALLTDPRILTGTDAKTGGVTLAIEPSSDPVVVGEPFSLDIVLDNRAYSNADGLGILLTYDPETLEILDADKGNWITLRTNILDGPFQDQFPWDMQIENVVQSARGTIAYRMGTTDENMTRGKIGTVARIYAVPLRATMGTKIEFAFSRRARIHGTEVTYMGQDCLGDPKVFGDGVTGVSFPVYLRAAEQLAGKAAGPKAKEGY